MPYDPAKPANNSTVASAEMRAQLQALNADTQTRATAAEFWKEYDAQQAAGRK